MTIQGLDIRGLIPAPPSWPTASLSQEQGDPGVPVTAATAEPTLVRIEVVTDGATLWFDRGLWTLTKEGLRGHLLTPKLLNEDDMAHPGLVWPVVVMARWLGRDVLHGGAFIAHGGAWGVIGPREAGKTTLLAHLHMLGVPIIADDQVVIDTTERVVMAAPRSIDLRPDAAKRLETETRVARRGERQRIDLPEVAPETPLRGWIRLCPGDSFSVQKVPPASRMPALVEVRTLPVVATNPVSMLEFTDVPFFDFKRPLRWEDAAETIERLLDAIA